MTVRYFCPIEPCGWYHDEADLEPPALVPWKRVPGAALTQLTDHVMTAEKVIVAHLECHPRLDFVQEISRQRINAEMMQVRADRERRRADAAETERDQLQVVLEKTAFLADVVDPLTTKRLPSRAEVGAVRELLGAAGGGVDD